MTAKKQSLIEMGVIIKDEDDINALLAPQNVYRQALCRYATAAAEFATNGKLPSLEFARNHHETEDIAMFDFTSLFSSRCAVRLVEKKGKTLLMGIVGDSLHEPFWPTGSGCARGFLGVLDTAWLIREHALNERSSLEMIAERESIYRLLAQVTKDNMHRALSKYSIDPRTRYVSLELCVQPEDARALISTDKLTIEHFARPFPSTRRIKSESQRQLLSNYALWRFAQFAVNSFKCKPYDLDESWNDGKCLAALISKFRPDVLDAKSVWDIEDYKRVYKRKAENELNRVEFNGTPKRCEPIERITRDLTDYKPTWERDHIAAGRNETVECGEDGSRRKIEKLDVELVKRVEQIVSGQADVDRVRDQRERRHREARNKTHSITKEEIQKVEAMIRGDDWQKKQELTRMFIRPANFQHLSSKEGKKEYAKSAGSQHLSSQDVQHIRVSAADARREVKSGFDRHAEREKFRVVDEKMKEAKEIMERRDLNGIDPFGKRAHEMQQQRGPFNKPIAPVPPTKPLNSSQTILISNPYLTSPKEASPYDSVNPNSKIKCQLCESVVYLAERMQVEGQYIHKNCFRCAYCGQPLRLGEHGKDHDLDYFHPFKFFCRTHLQIPLREKIAKINKLSKQQQERKPEIEPQREPIINRQEAISISPIASRNQPEERITTKILSYYTSPMMSPVITSSPGHVAIEPEDISQPTAVGRTPERAEFGAHRREPSNSALTAAAASSNQPLNTSISSESDEEESAAIVQSSDRTSDRERESGSNESDEEESLEDAEKDELDRTINQVVDESNGPLTEEMAKKVWKEVVQRKSLATSEPIKSRNESDNVIVMRRNVDAGQSSPGNKPRALSLMINAGSIETYLNDKVDNGTESIEEIAKKRMAEEIEKLKEQTRQKAKQKTDEQLGITSNRFSVPVASNLTPNSSFRDRSTTSSPPRARKLEAKIIAEDLPSHSRSNVDNSLIRKVEEPKPERIDAPNITGPPMQIHTSNERIHSESSKETNILVNKMKRMRVRQKTVEVLGSTVAAARAGLTAKNGSSTILISDKTDGDKEVGQPSLQVPCAAVAPSPRERKSKEEQQEPSRVEQTQEVTDRAVQYVQKRAEKIIR
ncbi:hypothetical protein WR25_25383 isoform A [Diploscapter pachys]|nr:hypothetical protein WR25_25383 isoform A [Diploscapter pachys]